MESFKYTFLLISFLLTFGCSSSADCFKAITIPEHMSQTATKITYNAPEDREVFCDYKTDDSRESFELKNFSMIL